MKQLIIFLLMLVYIPSISAQEIEKTPEGYKYQEVVEIKETDASELYTKIKSWVVLRANNANETIQLDDPENNQIIFKGNTKVSHLGKNSWVDLTMRFQTKEGRFRITITDFVYNDKDGNELSFNGAIMFKKKLIQNTTKKIHGLMNDLEDFIKSENSEDDDWE